jgi:hypothetical protein
MTPPVTMNFATTANVVATYLAKLKDIRDTGSELAFAAIFTDYIAGSLSMRNVKVCREHYGRKPIPPQATAVQLRAYRAQP